MKGEDDKPSNFDIIRIGSLIPLFACWVISRWGKRESLKSRVGENNVGEEREGRSETGGGWRTQNKITMGFRWGREETVGSSAGWLWRVSSRQPSTAEIATNEKNE